jgi:hypothetical protein
MPASNPGLSISDAAMKRIRFMLEGIRKRFGNEAIPAIMWVDARMNDGAVGLQPTIGFYDNVDEIKDDIVTINGLRVVIAVPDKDRLQFHGKTLHWDGNQFLVE